MKIIKNNISYLKKDKIENLTYKISSGKRLPINSKYEEDSKYKYIRVVDIINGKIKNENLKCISKELHEKLNNYIVKKGDLLLSNAGTIGSTCIVSEKENNYNLTENCLILKVNENNILNKYLYFYLISQQGYKDLERITVKTTIPKLPIRNLKELIINFPDLKQQEKISYILFTQEEQIERIKGLIKKLEKRNQYYAEKLLSGELRIRENNETGKTEFYENEEWQEVVFGCDIIKKKRRFPIEWKKDKLLNNIKLTKGISINSSKFNYENKGFQFLRTGDVWEDASSKKIPAFYDDKIDDKFFKNKYDYISCFEGFNKIPKKGTIGLVTNNGVGIISSHLYKTENMKINGKYIAVSLLNLSYIQDILMKNAIGSTVLSSTKCLKDIEFLFPDKEESIKIEKILSNLFNEVEILKELLPKEEKRFQWMLDNLLSGEYEVVED